MEGNVVTMFGTSSDCEMWEMTKEVIIKWTRINNYMQMNESFTRFKQYNCFQTSKFSRVHLHGFESRHHILKTAHVGDRRDFTSGYSRQMVRNGEERTAVHWH